jgi:exosortase
MIWILLLVGLLAHATLLWAQFQWMWSAQHFQFFPMALMAAAYLAYKRRGLLWPPRTTDDSDPPVLQMPLPSSRRLPVSVGLALVSIALFFAIALQYPLVGWLCFLAFTAILLFGSYGMHGVWVMMPVYVVLLVIKPLPQFLEQPLTIRMQQIATQLASFLLDLVGVLHYKQGVVLVSVGKSFLAEEACSGIRSLFSSITAIVFWGLLNRYSWRRTCVNVVQTVFWVLALNAVRIAVVIFIEEKLGFSIATGWRHDVVGVVVFFFIFGMVLSMDQLLASLIEPRINDETDEMIEESKQHIPKIGWMQWLRWPGNRTSLVAWCALFGFIALFGGPLIFMQPDHASGNTQATGLALPDEEYLPDELSGWKLDDFEHVTRPEQDLQGSDSFVWTYRDQAERVLVSLDGSFDDYHNLQVCYWAIGWQVTSDAFYTPITKRIQNEIDDSGEFTLLRLDKVTGEQGLVIFSAIDRHGNIVPKPLTAIKDKMIFLMDRFENSLRFAAGLAPQASQQLTKFVPPVSTIQVVYMPSHSIEETEVDRLRAFFFEIRERLQQSPRFQH